MKHVIVLELDDIDYEHVRNGISYRESIGPIPAGGGNSDGRTVAEIIRGWADLLGVFEWPKIEKETPE